MQASPGQQGPEAPGSPAETHRHPYGWWRASMKKEKGVPRSLPNSQSQRLGFNARTLTGGASSLLTSSVTDWTEFSSPQLKWIGSLAACAARQKQRQIGPSPRVWRPWSLFSRAETRSVTSPLRLLSSSFLGLPYRIPNMNHKKELLRSLSSLGHGV